MFLIAWNSLLCSGFDPIQESSAARTGTEFQEDSPKQEPKGESISEFDVPVADMPPVWSVQRPDFWYPFRFNMSEALTRANIHYRKGNFEAARSHAQEAIFWINVARSSANESNRLRMDEAIREIAGLMEQMGRDPGVTIREFDAVMARAHLALASHHLARALQLAEQGDDLFNACRRLIAAVDHARMAASKASLPADPEVACWHSRYSPYGKVDRKSIPEREQIIDDLDQLTETIQALTDAIEQEETDK